MVGGQLGGLGVRVGTADGTKFSGLEYDGHFGGVFTANYMIGGHPEFGNIYGKNGSEFKTEIKFPLATQTNTQVLQNKSGTIALLSDIAGSTTFVTSVTGTAVDNTDPFNPIINVTGIEGPAGPPGDKGDPGDAGAQGVPGIQGLIGSTGIQGAPGVDGATGPIGPTGLTGLTYMGDYNPATTYVNTDVVRDPTTGDAYFLQNGPSTGELPSTSTKWTLFVMEGATGPQGPPGVGTQGLPGATGPQGPPGLQGPVGLNGTDALNKQRVISGASGTISSTDLNYTIIFNGGVDCALVVNSTVAIENYECYFFNTNTVGTITITSSGITIISPEGFKLGPNKVATLIRIGNTDVYRLKGELVL